MKINIAFIIDTITCNTAGTQKQLIEIINRIDKDKFNVSLICLYNSDWLMSNYVNCNVHILKYRGFLKWNIPLVIYKLRRFLKKNKIQILHSYFEDSIFISYFASIFSNKPFLLSSRRDIGLGSGNHPWYHKTFELLLPFVNRSFSGIIANSHQVATYASHRENTPLDKYMVIWNGVELPTTTNKRFQFDRYDHFTGVTFGVVASLTAVKRHDLLLKAVSLLSSRNCASDNIEDFQVLLLGDGPERENIQELCRSLNLDNQVVFTGAVNSVDSYIEKMDVGILCSDREGLSNAILEYMAHGKPVIATDVGGNVELVDSDNGILVPADDEVALADAMEMLLVDSKRRCCLGEASLHRVIDCFSWDVSMSKLEDYYLDLVDKI
jgi:glycosyltransferase involved in cell wall biosynthesis